MRKLKYLQQESQSDILGDVDDRYQRLSSSLFPALLKLKNSQVKPPLVDLIDFVVPYLQCEFLC